MNMWQVLEKIIRVGLLSGKLYRSGHNCMSIESFFVKSETVMPPYSPFASRISIQDLGKAYDAGKDNTHRHQNPTLTKTPSSQTPHPPPISHPPL